jgi:cytochrome c biogenesis protein CcmG, thiol:disulfide interchange protein DsbE
VSRLLRPAMLLVAATLTTACGSGGGATPPGPNPNPDLTTLVATADLDPCPPSAATAVSGGLPDVTLSCLGKGPAVHMAGLTGTPTVVNIWGSWCVPCQAEEKYLSAAYDRTHRHVRFLGVDTVDQADSALDFAAHVRPPVHFPSVFDPDKKVLLGLHFQGPPETVYVDRSGAIVHVNRVPYTRTSEVIADIARYLHVAT